MRNFDTLTTSGIFRLIESIPSKNAEPFKLWLTNLGEATTQEIAEATKPQGLKANS